MAHPGDDWPHQAIKHDREQPDLVLEGRRSIFAAWPPGAVCERCGSRADAGYAGPAVELDSITYPAPEVRFVCRACARSMLNLGREELSGHPACGLWGCRNDVHVEIAMESIAGTAHEGPTETLARYREDYSSRGWRVLSVEPTWEGPRAIGTQNVRILFTPARKLW